MSRSHSRTRSRARSAAIAAAALSLAGLATPVAQAAPSPSPSVKLDPALYGPGDPTYDGVWRQSFALLALDTAGVEPSPDAVTWLVKQQCADGGWASFRADPAKDCAPKGEDTNATAAAVQALVALGGHDAQVKRAADWLRKVQNEDGGWAYNPGMPSDANSTALVTDALRATGADPATVERGGKSAREALAAFQLGCDAPAGQRGALAYQPDKKGTLFANDSATAAAALTLLGKGLPVRAPGADRGTPTAPACPSKKAKLAGEDRASAAAAYLAGKLAKQGQHLLSPQKGAGPDFASTAHAATALAAGGHLAPARKAVAWLEKESAGWAKGQPAALADLIFAVRATGGDARDAGGTDLVQQLVNLGPKPLSTGGGSQDAAGKQKDQGKDRGKAKEDKGGGFGVWYTVAIGLLVGVGGGFLLSSRRNKS